MSKLVSLNGTHSQTIKVTLSSDEVIQKTIDLIRESYKIPHFDFISEGKKYDHLKEIPAGHMVSREEGWSISAEWTDYRDRGLPTEVQKPGVEAILFLENLSERIK